MTYEEAFKVFPSSNAFIQFKGTDICMDLHCKCGYHNHFDGYFAHRVKCSKCGVVYAISPYPKIIEIADKGDSLLEQNEN